jgi:hypothetical protein
MAWLLVLLLIAVGVSVFAWAYRRRLDVLTGPWIADETSLHDWSQGLLSTAVFRRQKWTACSHRFDDRGDF